MNDSWVEQVSDSLHNFAESLENIGELAHNAGDQMYGIYDHMQNLQQRAFDELNWGGGPTFDALREHNLSADD